MASQRFVDFNVSIKPDVIENTFPGVGPWYYTVMYNDELLITVHLDGPGDILIREIGDRDALLFSSDNISPQISEKAGQEIAINTLISDINQYINTLTASMADLKKLNSDLSNIRNDQIDFNNWNSLLIAFRESFSINMSVWDSKVAQEEERQMNIVEMFNKYDINQDGQIDPFDTLQLFVNLESEAGNFDDQMSSGFLRLLEWRE